MNLKLYRRAGRQLCLPVLFLIALATWLPAAASGIEMFTYFGDGSRIGLPSLEVPIEAYPGIPLRSDRLRARRRAILAGPDAAVRQGPPGLPTQPGGITIRAMPTQPAAIPTR
jgi:hypothetical protein